MKSAHLLFAFVFTLLNIQLIHSQDLQNSLHVSLGLSVFHDMSGVSPLQSWGGGFEYIRTVSDRFSIGIGYESFKAQNDEQEDFFDPLSGTTVSSISGSFSLISQGFYANLSYDFLKSTSQTLAVQIGPALNFSKLFYVPTEIISMSFDGETGQLLSVNVETKVAQETSETLGFFFGFKYGFSLNDRIGLLLDARSRTFSLGGGENFASLSVGTFVRF